ncbi:hypothetical protein [Salinibaculum rarum]|uniref:hypothetical protein n=1 Tax=Salinibaculum rarum TaxID=3058903 RepID=UPI00265D7474|nr:hypothetical protein [Salinibaculum sp. KK48]
MAAILGDIEADQQPPMTVPLRHFVVALGFLLAGVLFGLGIALDSVTGFATLAHVHLLLAGWICITIMGAMTQFVPVWSGTTLHSRRLASLQLTLVVVGLLGFVTGLLLNSLVWLIPFGGLMLAGFWTFVYNIGRTMATFDSYDVTERHFLLSLGFFLVLTLLGFLLATGFTSPIFPELSLSRTAVVAMHATVAIFGAVLTTVYGALYQLGTMFTQTELHGFDEYLRRVEEIGHPVGVVLLAVGRLLDAVLLAQVGGVLVVGAALAFSVILARKLYEMQVEWTPMHTRYTVVVPSLTAWALLTLPAWIQNPTAPANLFGAPGTVHLFVLGAVGFVVFGTLYHIIPFIIWVHRYSDLLGYEPVPMIDDLYDGRLAAADGTLLGSGTLLLVATDWFRFSPTMQAIGGALVGLGILVFGANMLLVIHAHSPHPLSRILLGSLDPRTEPTAPGDPPVNE